MIALLVNICVLSLTLEWLCKCCVLLESCGQSSYKLNQSDIVTYYFPYVVETAPQARVKTTWYGGSAFISPWIDDLNDCLAVALDVLLPWRSGCSLTKQLLTFCLLHPCSIALSTHQLHHQVFPASNLNALPVPNAKQVCIQWTMWSD